MDVNYSFSEKLKVALMEGRGIFSNLSCKDVNELLSFSDTFDCWLDTDDVCNGSLFKIYNNLNKSYIPIAICDICRKLSDESKIKKRLPCP